VTQVDHRKGNVMSTQETSIVPFKSNQQTFEFVHPGKGAFGTETVLVDFGIEQALPTPFSLLPVTRVFGNIRDEPVIKASFTGFMGITGHIGIELSALKG
jgi:hypothetical protein